MSGPSLLSDARPSPAGNRDGHGAIASALGNLGSMCRDLTQGAPERILSVTWSKHLAAEIHLTGEALDALMDVEANPDGREDFVGLDHTVSAPDFHGKVAHHVLVTYQPAWGGGSVSATVRAVYDAEPAWLSTLLGKDGTPDDDLASALAASAERTGGAS